MALVLGNLIVAVPEVNAYARRIWDQVLRTSQTALSRLDAMRDEQETTTVDARDPVTTAGQSENTPVVTPIPEAPISYHVIANVAMYRSEPAKASQALAQFSSGVQLIWLGERELGPEGLYWLRMSTEEGEVGWIWEDLVERTSAW
jgi:hypothetical protein